jgi:hypothetical protein
MITMMRKASRVMMIRRESERSARRTFTRSINRSVLV